MNDEFCGSHKQLKLFNNKNFLICGNITCIIYVCIMCINFRMTILYTCTLLQVYADVCIGLFSLDVGVISICDVPKNTPSDVATVILIRLVCNHNYCIV
jgi:hypothetical protein